MSRAGSDRLPEGKELAKVEHGDQGARASLRVRVSRTQIQGLPVRFLRAGDANVLYVHGVPDSADLWRPFLERTGGIAVDLPGFGESGKPAQWPYSAAGFQDFLGALPRRARRRERARRRPRLGRGGAAARRPCGARRGDRGPAVRRRPPLAGDRARLAHPARGRAGDGLHEPADAAARRRPAPRARRADSATFRPRHAAGDPQARPRREPGGAGGGRRRSSGR